MGSSLRPISGYCEDPNTTSVRPIEHVVWFNIVVESNNIYTQIFIDIFFTIVDFLFIPFEWLGKLTEAPLYWNTIFLLATWASDFGPSECLYEFFINISLQIFFDLLFCTSARNWLFTQFCRTSDKKCQKTRFDAFARKLPYFYRLCVENYCLHSELKHNNHNF